MLCRSRRSILAARSCRLRLASRGPVVYFTACLREKLSILAGGSLRLGTPGLAHSRIREHRFPEVMGGGRARVADREDGVERAREE